MANGQNVPGTFTFERVSEAFNGAADDLMARLGVGDEGARDLINLVVNTGLHYLANPDSADVDSAIESNYEDDVDTVLGWSEPCVD